jgi:hypothetical protein
MKEIRAVIFAFIMGGGFVHANTQKDFDPQLGQTIDYFTIDNGEVVIEQYRNEGFDGQNWIVSFVHLGRSPRMGYDFHSHLWSSGEAQSLFQICEQVGGRLENIKVKAGKFLACKFAKDQHWEWLGQVPFWGRIKAVSFDGSYRTEVSRFNLESQ